MAKKTTRPPGSVRKSAPPPSRDAAPPPSLKQSDAIGDALRAAVEEPSRDDLWDQAEELAGAEQRPDDVASVYLHVLRRELPPDLADFLGQRAARFHDEWFEDAGPLVDVLSRVVDRAPDASWAFERLVLLFTGAARWDDLLALYDRALTQNLDNARKIQLLDEAAHVAKDFAGQADRSIHYLQLLLPLKPNDARLASSLERLFERQGRHRDLIDLWNTRLPTLPRGGALALRAKIARLWLEQLEEPTEALGVIEGLLKDDPQDVAPCKLLEQIVTMTTSSADVRRRALELLKVRYSAAKRTDDVVRVLRIALGSPELGEPVVLHREIANRLMELGKDEAALAHWGSVVAIAPSDAEARSRLRELAEKTGKHAELSDALVTAADACADAAQRIELLVEAGHVRCDVLLDAPTAITLYGRVLAAPEVDAATLLDVARRSSALLQQEQRKVEQLVVLERLSTLEPEVADRRAALGRAAHLAAELGDADRALAAWKHRLEEDAKDLEALDATIEVLERLERWPETIEVVRARVAATTDDEKRRADLVRIAQIHAHKLNAVAEAIGAWNEVARTFGENAQTIEALAGLLTTAKRWKELADLLEGAANRENEAGRRAELLHRLGDVHRTELDAPMRAAECYRDALAADSHNEGARAGLTSLLRAGGDQDVVALAAETLAKAYAETDDWTHTLAIAEHRIGAARSNETKTAILLEAARIEEERAGAPSAALGAVRRAFALSPTDRSIEREVRRLAEATQEWNVAVEAYRDAIANSDATLAAQLRSEQGGILEYQLADLPAALESYLPVLAVHPDVLEAADAVVRVAAQIGRWDAAADALVASARARNEVDGQLVIRAEQGAEASNAFDGLTRSMTDAVVRAEGLPPAVARDLETQIAVWHRDRRHDADAAEAALLRAVDHDGAHEATLRMLADLQRRAPGKPLLETLLRLADASSGDLGVLCEAAAIALDVLHDRGRSPGILTRLLETAAKRWESPHSRPTLPPQSAIDQEQAVEVGKSPESLATWALERLVGLHVERGDFKAAVEALVGGSALPFDANTSRSLRHRAGEIAARDLHDEPRAIELYRQILEEAPTDAQAITHLASLYESTKRYEDLIALRRHELSLGPELERRLELRLDVARVIGLAGGSPDGRLEALQENLDEEPGHPGSIDAVIAIQEAASDWAALARTLSEQSLRLESMASAEDARGARAAELWARVATIAETHLNDLDRALSSFGRVVALAPTIEALDSLARIHIARGEHAEAVEWLEKRLARTDAGSRTPTVLKLADEHIATGHRERALESLEHELDRDAGATEIRNRLAELYREGEAWEPLARLLNEGSAHVHTAPERLACLREAADIYQRHLRASHIAIPLLEDAVALAPNDRSVRTALADALRSAGRLDEARTMLEALVEEYGRRRPPERATVHLSLAQIAQARGDSADALAQLELASSMDMQNVEIFRLLGSTAREAGELARAERAYRTLLLIVRRPGSMSSAAAPVSHERRKNSGDGRSQTTTATADLGPSEVLFELYRIATDLGQPDRAQENLESAFEAAQQSEVEARRFTHLLRRTQNDELLLRALRASLGTVQDPTLAASILGEISEVSAALGRVDDALDASLQALSQSPESTALHDATRALAARADRLSRYTDTISDLAEQAQMKGDSALAGSLLLRLGALVEEQDPKKAADVYSRAEAMGVPPLPIWRALDRVYGTLGDTIGQARVLRQIVQVESDDLDAASKTEALYRLAEIGLAREDLRDEGVDMLTWAIDRDAQLERAATMLRKVPSDSSSEARVVTLYERVARASSEPAMILDALERSAALPDVGNEMLREAVEIAKQLEEGDRAEKLLRRAIAIARERESLGEAVWALVALAERRKGAGDVTEAITCLRDASEAGDATETMTLGLEAGALAAGPGGDLAVAAEIYEKLRAIDGSDRNVWKPLLDVYRQMGNRAQLESVIAATVDNVYDPQDRNQLRLERARLILDEGGREGDAVSVLREILEEEPDQREAATVLADVLERTGRQEELIELLRKLDDAARDRGDAATVAVLSTRLGKLLEKSNRAEAMDIYRSASHIVPAPDHKPLLEALVRLFKNDDDPQERADTIERLLVLEEGDVAAAMALDLAKIRDALHDDEAVLRALETGFGRAPQSDKLRTRLEKWLTEKEDWPRLANMLVVDAAARKDKRQAVARFREAAKIHREHLGDHAAEAAALQKAREVSPDDVTLLGETARALASAGRHDEAIAEASEFLQQHTGKGAPSSNRPTVLRLRAELRAPLGDDEGAVVDLEEAYSLAGNAVAQELATALDRLRTVMQGKGDVANEKQTTLRLVDVLSHAGEGDGAHDVLVDWVSRHEDDRESLEKLAEMDSAAQRWDGVIEAYKRLVALDTGEAQVVSALKLADACDAAGRSGDAREGLERAFQTAPGDEGLRARLRKAYEAAEAWAELASLTLADAQHAPDDATRFEKYVLAGEMRLRIVGEEWAAVEPLEAALKIKAGSHDATVLLADAYTMAGMIDEAVALLDKAITAHKGRRSRELASLMHRMARAANAGGGHDVELAWLQKALDIDMQNGQVAAELAELAIELQQYEIALKALKAITLLRNPGPMSRAMASLLQGRIAYTQGDAKRAVLLAKKALSEDPKLQAAHDFLKEIGAA